MGVSPAESGMSDRTSGETDAARLEQLERENRELRTLLEATLGNRQRYEVLASLNLLKHDHYDALKQVCPYLERRSEPGSLYFRIRSSDRE